MCQASITLITGVAPVLENFAVCTFIYAGGGGILGASYKLPTNMIIFYMQVLNMFITPFISPFITHSKISIKYMQQIVIGYKYMQVL